MIYSEKCHCASVPFLNATDRYGRQSVGRVFYSIHLFGLFWTDTKLYTLYAIPIFKSLSHSSHIVSKKRSSHQTICKIRKRNRFYLHFGETSANWSEDIAQLNCEMKSRDLSTNANALIIYSARYEAILMLFTSTKWMINILR